MSRKDRKNLADAKTFAVVYTIVTTLLILGVYAISVSWLSSVPIIGSIIGGFKIAVVCLTSLVHIGVAALINAYFSLFDTRHKRLGYGYYAQRKGVGPHRKHPLERNTLGRVGLFILHTTIISSITGIVAGLLGCFSLGAISIASNTIMMLMQRLIFTPKRARKL